MFSAFLEAYPKTVSVHPGKDFRDIVVTEARILVLNARICRHTGFKRESKQKCLWGWGGIVKVLLCDGQVLYLQEDSLLMETGSRVGQCQLLALLPFTVWCLLPICLTEGSGETTQSAKSSSSHKHTMLYYTCFSAYVLVYVCVYMRV